MPVIRTFRGVRYNTAAVGSLRDVVAPPYDIIYDEWRDRLYERSPYNIIRLIKAKDLPGDTPSSNRYTRSRDFIDEWIRDGVLVFDDRPVLYVLSDTFTVDGEQRTRFGWIALLKTEEFGGSIHPHERTLSAPKADRINLVKATKTNFSQIFSVYRDPGGAIQEILREVAQYPPAVDFVDEQDVIRRMWLVDDPGTVSRIQLLIRDRDIIIADGHHRYETALAYRAFMEPNRTSPEEPFDYVSMYFSSADDPGMTILPTHRKAGGLNGFHPESFLESLSREFEVVEQGDVSLYGLLRLIQKDAARKNVFGLFTGGRFFTATYRSNTSPKAADVEILHEHIVERILGISQKNIEKGRNLHFSKSPEHAYEDVVSGKDQVAFFMNAVSTEELFRVVLQGRRMPQKSTYFYPKTLSGLVMYRIEGASLG